ncbi:chitin deacetylase cda1 [Naganishia cerealis]|uniref:Chitin deacetylase cda1 n=1 Tax=Naganishia cerealis TaxID=610337 RepID=A0ACC2V6U3_9TREE|nr:chitin deacetylase cda1 [Naganishia cerealis]
MLAHPLAIFALVAGFANAQSSVTSSAASAAASVVVPTTVTSSGVAVVTSATSSIDTAGLTLTPKGDAPSSYSIPDATAITMNMPTQSTIGLDTTYPGGTKPTAVANAPVIPSSFPAPASYPALDKVPPINSTEVQGWLSKLDLSDVPNYSTTTGACFDSPEAVKDTSRCWWTCGGCTRSTDIVECPNKYDWGLSYDDGPSPYTPILLDYLNEHDLTTTFFVVGSRVISRPEMLVSEYVSGHQISVHTWSHPYLTNLTNEQIVAELGWTMKAIRETIGVTPNTFRPPYGDIDDRVRAVAAKMGLTPVMWSGTEFDTTDWNIPGGRATGVSSLSKFRTILQTAESMNTGFIVLSHDLYQQTVDLAVGYMIPQALEQGKWKLKSISDCLGWSAGNAYIETSDNRTVINNQNGKAGTSFPVAQGASATGSSSSSNSGSSGASQSGMSTSSRASASGSGASAAASPSSKSGALGIKDIATNGVLALAGVAAVATWLF